MNFRITSLVVLFLSIFIFSCQHYRSPRIEREYLKLMAEYDSNTSVGNYSCALIQSFFDGLTFGQFADEGIFTEYKKWERMDATFARRKAQLEEDWMTCQSRRSWSLVFILLSLGCLLFAPTPRYPDKQQILEELELLQHPTDCQTSPPPSKVKQPRKRTTRTGAAAKRRKKASTPGDNPDGEP